MARNLTHAEEALRDAYLAEMWPVCRELPRDVRAGNAAVAQVLTELVERPTIAAVA